MKTTVIATLFLVLLYVLYLSLLGETGQAFVILVTCGPVLLVVIAVTILAVPGTDLPKVFQVFKRFQKRSDK